MMQEPRRRSPESSRRRRAERRQSREQRAGTTPTTSAASAYYYYDNQTDEPFSQPGLAPNTSSGNYDPPPTTAPPRTRKYSTTSSSSSTSSSLLNISRRDLRFTLRSFFTRRRSSRRMRKRASFRAKNGSSSSVDSDLAYGRGYIPKMTVASTQRFASSVEADRSAVRRSQTDEDILDIGRRLQEYAHAEDDGNLERSGRSRPSQMAAAAMTRHNFGRSKTGDRKERRGVSSSRPRPRGEEEEEEEEEEEGEREEEDSGWESASDDSSSFSSSEDADMGLAYGASQTYLPLRQTQMHSGRRRSGTAAQTLPLETIRPPHRKNSAVDPSMFGPQNSLRGLVSPLGYQPVRHAKEHQPRSLRRSDEPVPQSSSAPIEVRPMQRVYPVPTSDPGRFDAASPTAVSYSVQDAGDFMSYSRPAPVPIQAPTPRVPISTRVLEEQRMRDERRDSKESIRRKPDGNKEFSAGAAAAAGIAAAVVGAAAMLSDRKEKRERDEREAREKERQTKLEKDESEPPGHEAKRRDQDRDSEVDDKRHSQRGSVRATPIVMFDEETFGKRREKTEDREKEDMERDSKNESARLLSSDTKKGTPEERKEQRRRERERTQQMLRELRKEIERERALAAARKGKAPEPEPEPEPESSGDGNKQAAPRSSPPSSVPVDPFQYQVGADAFSTPTYDTPRRPLTPIIVEAEPKFLDEDTSERLSRRDSFEMEMERARAVVEASRHSYMPPEAAVMSGALPAVAKLGHEKDRHRDPEPVRDPQDEANRAYRERMMARRLAEEQLRSRSDSPTPSVVDKYEKEKDQGHQKGVDMVRVVTPPATKPTNKYDGPNADVRIDNVIMPHDLDFYRLPRGRREESTAVQQMWVARDPSCERERPLLNLVLPTPVATPSPEKQRAQDKMPEPQAPEMEMAMEKDGTTPPTPETVSWAENDRDEGAPRISPWDVVAAAVAGAATAGVVAPHYHEPEDKKTDDIEIVRASGETLDRTDAFLSSSSRRIVLHLDEDDNDDDDDEAPKVGPKPTSPLTSHMPGAFGDDVDFVATLAASLQGTGFDPKIVTEDPTYLRRDSPPGSNEPEEMPAFGFVYQQPFSQTVSDLGFFDTQPPARFSEPGFVIGEVSEESPISEKDAPLEGVDEALTKTPEEDWEKNEETPSLSDLKVGPSVAAETQAEDTEAADTQAAKTTIIFEDSQQIDLSPMAENVPSEKKLSKKERRKLEKEAKSQQLRNVAGENPETTKAEVDVTLADAGEDEWADTAPKKKKGKKKGKSQRTSDPSWEDALESQPADETKDASASPEDTEEKSFLANAGTLGAGVGLAGVAAALVAAQSSRSKAVPAPREEPGEEEEGKETDGSKASGDGHAFDHDDIVHGAIKSSTDVQTDDVELPDSRPQTPSSSGRHGNAPFWLVEDIGRVSRSRAGRTRDVSRESQAVDPEVLVHRVIKPAIDPQYGDLLPLPPSEPGSPHSGAANVADLAYMPALPDSRPDTPPGKRRASLGSGGGTPVPLRTPGSTAHVRRRSGLDSTTKSPSHTAVPLQFRLGPPRGSGSAGPSSPATPPGSSMTRFAWPPVVHAPRTPTFADPAPVPRALRSGSSSSAGKPRAARPSSWDSSREIKPLYLLEKTSVPSLTAVHDEACGTELPPSPSEPASRGSPSPDLETRHEKEDHHISSHMNLLAEQPAVGTDTSLVKEAMSHPEPVDPTFEDRSSYLPQQTPTPIKKPISGEHSQVSYDEFPSQRLAENEGGLSGDHVLEAALLAAGGVGMADLVAAALRGDHEASRQEEEEEEEEEQQKLHVVPEESADHVPESTVLGTVSSKEVPETRDFPEQDFGYVPATRGEKGKKGFKNRNADLSTKPSSESQSERAESAQRKPEPPGTMKKGKKKKKKKGKQVVSWDDAEVEDTASGVQTRQALDKSSAGVDDAILPAHDESSASASATRDVETMALTDPGEADVLEPDLPVTRDLVGPVDEEGPTDDRDVFDKPRAPDASSSTMIAEEPAALSSAMIVEEPELVVSEPPGTADRFTPPSAVVGPDSLRAEKALPCEVSEKRDLPQESADADPAVHDPVSEEKGSQEPEASIREPEQATQESKQVAQEAEQAVDEREKKIYLPSAVALLPALPSVGSFFSLGKKAPPEVDQSVLADSSGPLPERVEPLPDVLTSTTTAQPMVEPGNEQSGSIRIGTALEDALTFAPAYHSVGETTLHEPPTAISGSADQGQEQAEDYVHSLSRTGDDVDPPQNVEVGKLRVEAPEDPTTLFETPDKEGNEGKVTPIQEASPAPEPDKAPETNPVHPADIEVPPEDVSWTEITSDPQVIDEAPLRPVDDSAGDDISSELMANKPTHHVLGLPLEEGDRNCTALTETDAPAEDQFEQPATSESQALPVDEGASSSEQAVDKTAKDHQWLEPQPSGEKNKKGEKKKQAARDAFDFPIEEPASAISEAKPANPEEPAEVQPDEQGEEKSQAGHVREPEFDEMEGLHAESAPEQTAPQFPTPEVDDSISPVLLDASQPDASSAATASQKDDEVNLEPEADSWSINKRSKKDKKKRGSVVDLGGSGGCRDLPAASKKSMDGPSSKPDLGNFAVVDTKKSKKDKKKKKRQSVTLTEALEDQQAESKQEEPELAMDAPERKNVEESGAGARESERREGSEPSEREASVSQAQGSPVTGAATAEQSPSLSPSHPDDVFLATEPPALEKKLEESEQSESMHIRDPSETLARVTLTEPGAESSDLPRASQTEQTELSVAPSNTVPSVPSVVASHVDEAATPDMSWTKPGSSTSEDVVPLHVTEATGRSDHDDNLVPAPGSNPVNDEMTTSAISSQGHQAAEKSLEPDPYVLPESDLLPVAPPAEVRETVETDWPMQMDAFLPEPHGDNQTQLAQEALEITATPTGDLTVHETPECRDALSAEEGVSLEIGEPVHAESVSGIFEPETRQTENSDTDAKALQSPEISPSQTDDLDHHVSEWVSPEPSQVPDSFMDSVEYITPLTTQEAALEADEPEVDSPVLEVLPDEAESKSRGDQESEIGEFWVRLETIPEEDDESMFPMTKSETDERAMQATPGEVTQPGMVSQEEQSHGLEPEPESKPEPEPEPNLETCLVEDHEPAKQLTSDDDWSSRPTTVRKSENQDMEAERPGRSLESTGPEEPAEDVAQEVEFDAESLANTDAQTDMVLPSGQIVEPRDGPENDGSTPVEDAAEFDFQDRPEASEGLRTPPTDIRLPQETEAEAFFPVSRRKSIEHASEPGESSAMATAELAEKATESLDSQESSVVKAKDAKPDERPTSTELSKQDNEPGYSKAVASSDSTPAGESTTSGGFDHVLSVEATAVDIAGETSGPTPSLEMPTPDVVKVAEVAEAAEHLSSGHQVPAAHATDQPSAESEHVELDSQTRHILNEQDEAYMAPKSAVEIQGGDSEVRVPDLAGCIENPEAEKAESVHSDTISQKEIKPEGPRQEVPPVGAWDKVAKKSKQDKKKKKKRLNWELGLEALTNVTGETAQGTAPVAHAERSPRGPWTGEASTANQTEAQPEPQSEGSWELPAKKSKKGEKRGSKAIGSEPASGISTPAVQQPGTVLAAPIVTSAPPEQSEAAVTDTTQAEGIAARAMPVGKGSGKNKRRSEYLDWEEEAVSSQQDSGEPAGQENAPNTEQQNTLSTDEPADTEVRAEAVVVDETAMASAHQEKPEEKPEPSGQSQSVEAPVMEDAAEAGKTKLVSQVSQKIAQPGEEEETIPDHLQTRDFLGGSDDAATLAEAVGDTEPSRPAEAEEELLTGPSKSVVQEQAEGPHAAVVEDVQKPRHDDVNRHVDAVLSGPRAADLTPAQERSSILHDKPFDYSAHRKKAKTRDMDSFVVPEQDMDAVIPGRHSDGDVVTVLDATPIRAGGKRLKEPVELPRPPVGNLEKPLELPPTEPALPPVDKLEDVDEHHTTEKGAEVSQEKSARDLAASYLERSHGATPVEAQDMHDAQQVGQQVGQQEKAKENKAQDVGTALVAGGVARLAEKFGGSMKSKKGAKANVVMDNRKSREEDMFDDAVAADRGVEAMEGKEKKGFIENTDGQEDETRTRTRTAEPQLPDEDVVPTERLRESVVGGMVSSLAPVPEEEHEVAEIIQDSGRPSEVKKRLSQVPVAPAPAPAASAESLASNVPRRSASNTSLARRTPEPLNLRSRPETPGSAPSQASTPSLRRAFINKRSGGDLRSMSRSQREAADDTDSPASPATGTAAAALDLFARGSQNSSPVVANEGRVRAKGSDMADVVIDGYGEGRMGSPRSPTRPHSMRRRQSMQVLELESKVEQLASENRALAEARALAETALTQKAAAALSERDSEIERLTTDLEKAQETIDRLQQMFEGQQSSVTAVALMHSEDRRQYEERLADADRKLQAKHFEMAQLRSQLEAARDRMQQLQAEVAEIAEHQRGPKADDADFLDAHSIDHFDRRCQQLCSHLQQWVLRFSKFSDMRACRLTSEISDDKLIDRLDNALLDGGNVDTYLGDRVRRRDIFMSMVSTMIWELVFTRYLFGMDREQRQKLKALEKQLLEVGPVHAVRQWRAVTLTLLSRRPAFARQRDADTEAVVHAVLDPLTRILPPPDEGEPVLRSQLRKVTREAVQLAIDMRCQRPEYQMLPPLQPEYDEAGELAERVYFNAALMQERVLGGTTGTGTSTSTNTSSTPPEELEANGAAVRVVLFPLVVRKGADDGRGDDEVVVCPAQVLVAVEPGHDASSSGGGGGGGVGGGARLATSSSDAGGASLYRGSAASGGHASNTSVTMTDAPPPPPAF